VLRLIAGLAGLAASLLWMPGSNAALVTLVGSGDIGPTGGFKTLALAESLRPTAYFFLGDFDYSDAGGTFDWAPVQSKMPLRAIGNHDGPSDKGGPSSYQQQFGRTATWYSSDLNGVHFVVLDGNQPSNPKQVAWLNADLARSKATCKVALWHQPLRSSDSAHSNNNAVLPLWNASAKGGVDLVLNGHAHVYERFAPKDGMVQITSGLGGESRYGFQKTAQPGSMVRYNADFGVLQLTVGSNSIGYRFESVGKKVIDSGTVPCR
jgi:hypothetical protein